MMHPSRDQSVHTGLQMAFGEGTYAYGRLKIPSVPPPPFIETAFSYIRKHSTIRFVLVNKYSNGKDSVSAHADDESTLRKEDPIFSLSLGATRRFIVRPVLHGIPKAQKTQANRVLLGPYNPGASSLFTHPTIPYSKISVEVEASDNVLLVMAGSRFQTDFIHEVPRSHESMTFATT